MKQPLFQWLERGRGEGIKEFDQSLQIPRVLDPSTKIVRENISRRVPPAINPYSIILLPMLEPLLQTHHNRRP